MLNKRYEFDGKPSIKLNEIQLENKKIVEDKIKSKEYVFEKVDCVICNGSNFELLAEKDRYGLQVFTVICRDCGLLQTNPRMNQESYNDFYNRYYTRLYNGKDIVTESYFDNQKNHGKKILDFVEETIGEKFTNKFVVEIGCGSGGILKAFKENTNKIYGLDLGSEYINFGKGKGLNLEIGTIKKLKHLGIKPDLVIYSHVLEHILNPYEELKELKDYLKSDSLVYIEVPGFKNLENPPSWIYQDFLRYLQNAHVYHFSLNTLNNLAKKSGFKLVYGNEIINSIFKIGEVDSNIKDNYEESISFLRKFENRTSNKFNLLRIRSIIYSSTISLIKFIARRSGIFNPTRRIYYSLKNRK